MKRRYSGAPAWVDYLIQALYWLDDNACRLIPPFRDWAYRLLDRFCRCEKCKKRALGRIVAEPVRESSFRFPMVIDPSMSKDTIEFRGPGGRLLGKAVNLTPTEERILPGPRGKGMVQ